MSAFVDHISVCICTLNRPKYLAKLLTEIEKQNTDGLFSHSVVVVDNDGQQSARRIIESFQKASNKIHVAYYCEPEQSISLARNKAVSNTTGNLLAFIDDDEFPTQDWLVTLYKVYRQYNVDGILGPVLPCYETTPPKWIIKGNFFVRPSHKTGRILHWDETRAGNVLIRKDIFDEKENLFRPEYGRGGEDKDFFQRMIEKGMSFAWCEEAPVYEAVPPERYKRSFMLRRALLRGKTPYNHNLVSYLKSFIAIPLLTILLPFLFLTQHHIFMKYLIKYFDHVGRFLALLGLDVINQKYVVK